MTLQEINSIEISINLIEKKIRESSCIIYCPIEIHNIRNIIKAERKAIERELDLVRKKLITDKG